MRSEDTANYAADELIRDAKAPSDFAQRQNAAIRRQQAAFGTIHLRIGMLAPIAIGLVPR